MHGQAMPWSWVRTTLQVLAKWKTLVVFWFDVVSSWDLVLLKDSACSTVLGRKGKPKRKIRSVK